MTDTTSLLAQDVPTAHQGFLARSESVLVELLYAHASHQGKRLVLCGEELILLCCFFSVILQSSMLFFKG